MPKSPSLFSHLLSSRLALLFLSIVPALAVSCRSTGGTNRAGTYALYAGGEQPFDPSSPRNTSIPTVPPAPAADIQVDPVSRGLGDGFDSSRKIKLSPCVDPSLYVYRGANSSELSFMRDFTYDQIMNEVGLGIYAQVNLLGIVKVRVQGDMAASLATTNETSSFIYNFKVLGKSAVIDRRVLNYKGMAAYQTMDLSHFRDECGDLFVEQIKLGAQLFVGVKFTYGSRETKEKIMLTLKGSALWGLIKFSKTWSKEFKQLMENVRVSVEAFQIGGDPRQLEAFKNEINTGSCAGNEPEACAETVDRLLEYGRTGFTSQLTNLSVSNDEFTGPAIVGIATDSYNSQKIYDPTSKSQVLINVKPSTTTADELAVITAQLNRVAANLQIALNRVITLSEFNLTDDEKTIVKAARSNIESTLKAATDLRDTTCKNAIEDASLVKSCGSLAGLIETQASKVSAPISLNNR